MKKFITREGQEFKIEVSYSLGGMNHVTSQVDKRGYSLFVIPVIREQREGYMVERTKSYTGYKKFLLEVGRKSKKAEQEAIHLAEEIEDELIDKILLTIER